MRYVYIAELLDRSALKVGISNDPPRRVRDLTAEHGAIRLLMSAEAPGGYATEKAIHKSLNALRLSYKGEWYGTPEPNVALGAAIDAVVAECGLTSVRVHDKAFHPRRRRVYEV